MNGMFAIREQLLLCSSTIARFYSRDRAGEGVTFGRVLIGLAPGCVMRVKA
jgi:hypothetical protein